MREKGWEERGPKAHSKDSDFGTPMILVLFSVLPYWAAQFWKRSGRGISFVFQGLATYSRTEEGDFGEIF